MTGKSLATLEKIVRSRGSPILFSPCCIYEEGADSLVFGGDQKLPQEFYLDPCDDVLDKIIYYRAKS